jgi:hypothetical protein
MINEIKNIPLYSKVLDLATNSGYSFSVFLYDKGDLHYNEALGYHDVDLSGKEIKIGISKKCSDVIPIAVHELLHAKFFLKGFPKLQIYTKVNLSPGAEKSVLEVENIAQHTLIYPEMKRLGYSQEKYDLEYFNGVKEDNSKKFDGANKISRALKLLEVYYRLPRKMNEIDEEVSKQQPIDYSLYRKMRKSFDKTETPQGMKKGIVDNIKLIDKFVKKQTGEDTFLRYLCKLDIGFTEYQLQQKASRFITPIKFNEFPDSFLVHKEHDFCIGFINGRAMPIEKLKVLLENNTIEELYHKNIIQKG